MKEILRVEVDNGKYTIIQYGDGRVKALRYDKEWRDCTGDGLLLALAYEVDKLRGEINALQNQ